MGKKSKSKAEVIAVTGPSNEDAAAICSWYRAVCQKEEDYYAAAQKCIMFSRAVDAECVQLQSQLNATPDVDMFVELARKTALAASLRDLSLNAPFNSRQYRLAHRAALNPGSVERISDLLTWSENYAKPRLEAAQKADAELTKKLDAKDPIVSGPTRRITRILDGVDLVREKLNAFEADDRGDFWVPFQSVVAVVEEILARDEKA